MKFSVRTTVAIGIGAAVFFILFRFASIPSPIPNTSITTAYPFLAMMAVIFGPVAGMLIGIIGHTLNDISWGMPWWSWIISSGVVGLIVGMAAKRININEGVFGAKQILLFNVFQILAHVIAWIGIAPSLDILIYHEPIEKLYAQGAVAATSNIIVTGVIGTLLLVAYAATKTKRGSLSKED